MTVNEVAKKLKVTPRRVRVLILEGRIDAKKMGRDWLITDYSRVLKRVAGNPHHTK